MHSVHFFLFVYIFILPTNNAFSISSLLPIRKTFLLQPSFSTVLLTSKKTSKEEEEEDDIEGWDWEEVANGAFSEDQRPIVLFDGVCNLCNGGVNFAIDRDESAKLRFCSLQSKVAEALLLRSGHSPDESNIAFVTKEDAYFSSEAVAKICMQLDTKPLQILGQIGQITPNWVRESVYKYVSTNRYYFGENDQCRLDFDGTYTSRFVSDPTEFEDVK